MFRVLQKVPGGLLLAACIAACPQAAGAEGFSFSGYADLRLILPPKETGWLNGGLGKFRYGGHQGNIRFAEATGQISYAFDDSLSAVTVLRAEPEQRTGLDVLEAYAAWHPARGEAPVSWSVKAGAFFPAISLENGDLGWSSPYTLTSSAIDSWVGEELRTLGGEATLRWRTPGLGTLSVIAALTCCNDQAGILMAGRGWAMDDRPTGLIERVRVPDATQLLFRSPTPARTGMFDEIDSRPGWYAGIDWQMAGIGKFSVLRYDNRGDPTAKSARDTAWDTRFYSYGFRTGINSLVLIAQGLQGQTIIIPRPGIISDTKFQAAFLLASYDFDDWRLSAREDLFQTRRVSVAPSPFSEDGHAFTASLSWQEYDWLRVTGEVVSMVSRRGEYTLPGASASSAQLSQTQFQLSTRFLY